jgi:methylenetetrahydrofolate reductase (NADPH)
VTPVQSPIISFEFFPPKTQEANDHLTKTAAQLAECQPAFFSVTFGAGGSTREGTVETVKLLQNSTNTLLAPHLSCIGSSRQEMLEMLAMYQAMGVRRIIALRGDLPSGMGQSGEFQYASELVSLIREATGDYFHIEVAAYPEIHPQATTALADILNLKRKFEAGANSAITQYFFNPDAYFYYMEECAAHGIDMSIVPGIMPITQYSRLARFSDMCGAEIPRWIRKRLELFGDDVESMQAVGFEIVYELCQRLLAGGAPGLHFYTLNRAEASLRLIRELKLKPQLVT